MADTGRRSVLAPPPVGVVGPGPRPTFSVVIPAYQAADTIAEAVESALDQTLAPLEIVVCDDGSTDDLGSALDPYLDRIKLVRKENGGEGSAKDAGARAAAGDFVVILDADDAFLPERLEAISELAVLRPDLDILTTDAFLESRGTIVRRSYTPEWTFEVADQRGAILQRNFIFSAAAIRRERYLAVGGFDRSARFAADWHLWIRLILSGSRAGLVDEPLYRYRIGPNALSAQRPRLVRGFIDALEAATGFDLSDDERAILGRSIEERRRELLQLRLREAIDGREGVRRAALAVALERGLPRLARLRAAVPLVSPALARHRLGREAGWVGAGGTLVPRTATLKLVAYTDAPEIGGAEISLGNLLAELPSEYAVTVIGVSADVVAKVARRRPGTRERIVPPVHRKHQVLRILEHVWALRREHPRIVHMSMNTPWACRYGIAATLLATRARLVLVEQALFPTDSRLQQGFKRIAARRAAVHVAVGERSAREIERLSGLRSGSVGTIYNGLPDAGPPPVRAQRSRTTIGSVGRLDRVKGYDVLLDAVASLSDVHLVLVGDGPERSGLEDRARRLSISHRLTVSGWVAEPRDLLLSLDVFVLPSRLESFPLSIVEAMLAGLPVVATDVGSVGEAVVPGDTGLLVPPNDPAALAAAIRSLVDDPERRLRLGRNGRARALELFTATAMANAFDSAYRKVLEKR